MLKTYFKVAGATTVIGCSLAGMTTVGYLAYRGLRMLVKHELAHAHELGYDDGFAHGERRGHSEGMDVGKNFGLEEGYCRGYDEGYLHAHDGKQYQGHTVGLLEKFGLLHQGADMGFQDGFDEIMKIFEKGAARSATEVAGVGQSRENGQAIPVEGEGLIQEERVEPEAPPEGITDNSDEMGGDLRA